MPRCLMLAYCREKAKSSIGTVRFAVGREWWLVFGNETKVCDNRWLPVVVSIGFYSLPDLA